ncbi:MAG: outer membrane protein transport protein [Desulfuromonadales bacterium]
MSTEDKRTERPSHHLIKGLLTVILVLLPNLVVAEIGPALSGLTGSANDATAVFFSPAGITRLDQSEMVVQAAFMFKESKFEVDEATYSGGDSDNDQQIAVIPGVFYARPLNERWHLGLSVNVPSGFGNNYGDRWSGRYHTQESTLAFVAATGVLAYELTEKLSLAAGPYAMYTDSTVTARVNNLLPGYGDGKVELEEDGADLGFVLGAMYQFTDTTRVGLTYRSELKPDLEGTPTFKNLDPLLRETLAAADLLGTEVDVDFTIPAMASVGFYTEVTDEWSVTGDLVWLDMSEFGITHLRVEEDSVSVNSKFRDMWATSASIKYRYAEDRAISIGGLYASSAVTDDNRDVGLPLDRTIGGGVGWELPIRGYPCHINLNYFDLGDAEVSQEGGPLTGDFEGSFSSNWAVMLDIQVKLAL